MYGVYIDWLVGTDIARMSLIHLHRGLEPELSPAAACPEGHSTNRALVDRFRCAESLGCYSVSGELSRKAGYFRLDRDAICFSRSSGPLAGSPAGNLFDIKPDIAAKDSVLTLPFDPTEAIDNLRLERYRLEHSRSPGKLVGQPFVRSAYYSIRPLLPVRTRKHLQRIALRGWSDRLFPRWPVDRTVEQILEELLVCSMQASRLDSVPFIWFWPEGYSSCTTVTHDVETEQGRQFCSDLMDIDDSFEIKASFQVVPDKRYVVTNRYLDGLRTRGFEVNVHDWNHDGHLFRDREEFLRRAKLINRFACEHSAQGFRAGMLYRNVDWYDALDVSYDMSVPNVAHLDPQRGGCCTVFPYFIGDLLEIPVTTTQDYSLFHILNDYSIDLWKRQCRLIMQAHGLMSFIIHPDYLFDQDASETYKELLGYLSDLREERNTWIALPGEINIWWRQRHQMSIVRQDGKWCIVGPGSERARLAYARLDNGRVTYTLDEPNALEQ